MQEYYFFLPIFRKIIHQFLSLYSRERLDTLEKEVRLKSLQRSPGGHSHSHDSAIDSDLQEWETENIDIDMVSPC